MSSHGIHLKSFVIENAFLILLGFCTFDLYSKIQLSDFLDYPFAFLKYFARRDRLIEEELYKLQGTVEKSLLFPDADRNAPIHTNQKVTPNWHCVLNTNQLDKGFIWAKFLINQLAEYIGKINRIFCTTQKLLTA